MRFYYLGGEAKLLKITHSMCYMPFWTYLEQLWGAEIKFEDFCFINAIKLFSSINKYNDVQNSVLKQI